jgi:hypothetical protein
MGSHEGRRRLTLRRCRWYDNINMDGLGNSINSANLMTRWQNHTFLGLQLQLATWLTW